MGNTCSRKADKYVADPQKPGMPAAPIPAQPQQPAAANVVAAPAQPVMTTQQPEQASTDKPKLPQDQLNKQLVQAIKDKNTDSLQKILSQDANVNFYVNNSTPLHIAAEVGHSGIVEILLKAGANVNAEKADTKATPLFVACEKGHINVVKQFVSARANLNARGKPPKHESMAPLHIAVLGGYTEAVKQLVSAGADANIQTDSGATPLHFASQEGKTEIVKLLLDHRADARCQLKEKGVTPLFLASLMGHSQVVSLLVDYGADVNLGKSVDGTPPLYAAAAHGHVAVMDVLLKKGAEPNRPSNHGITPLAVAVSKRMKPAVRRLLLQEGINVDVQDDNGITPLLLAVASADVELVELLVNKKADCRVGSKILSLGIPPASTPITLALRLDRNDILLILGESKHSLYLQAFQILFHLVDENHDDWISLDEMLKFWQTAGLTRVSKEEVERVFAEVGANKKRLELGDFIEVCDRLCKVQDAYLVIHIRNLFELFDSRDDERVGKDELVRLMKSTQMVSDQQGIDSLLRDIGQEGSTTVSWSEFFYYFFKVFRNLLLQKN
eukprot:GILK01001081.1.p1 GENE.GILK01001081.1~~GILK01001081.1.p1  ORF type:complete len:557 (-),score=106.73 GILK01001081.1:167-1837(-)